MAAPPPPVDVFIPPAPAAPEGPLFVNAADAIVTSLPWLPWGPAAMVAGVQRVSISNSEALKAFAVKCKLDRSPPAVAAMAPLNPLTLKMGAGAWSRILTAVRDNGLSSLTLAVVEELHAYIRDKVPIVILGAADWAPAPALGAGNNAAQRAASGRRVMTERSYGLPWMLTPSRVIHTVNCPVSQGWYSHM